MISPKHVYPVSKLDIETLHAALVSVRLMQVELKRNIPVLYTIYVFFQIL